MLQEKQNQLLPFNEFIFAETYKDKYERSKFLK